jgi:hypothetical protein
MFCKQNQWGLNQGRCGICGDPYQGPRENEAGGKYAKGTIVRHYKEGQNIDVEIGNLLYMYHFFLALVYTNLF